MVWKQLEKENVSVVLDRLGTDPNAIVFSKEFTEIVWDDLPFYSRFDLYRLVNYATMPSFSMEYLSDGNVFIPLDGTANPIYAINEESPIKLTEKNVVDYLEFFFSHVRGSDGDIYLIKDPEKMPGIESLDPAQQKNVKNSHKPLTIEAGSFPGQFIIRGTLFYSGCLISATVRVSSEGRLSFIERDLLLRDIAFPHNAVNYYWMGE
tara:strand:- start:3583 stop:4203 length:621 start_codon:yes stop_codon:yes gene_type:complete